jgi:hypothetical protein
VVLGVEIELTVAASLFRRRIEVYKHDGYLSSSSILVVIKQAHLATDSLISERIGLVIVAVVILIYTTKGFFEPTELSYRKSQKICNYSVQVS